MTKRFGHALSEEGHIQAAEKLSEIMAAGFTGTEILMGLRQELQQILVLNLDLTQITRMYGEQLISAIVEILDEE
jgi:hypothetical protein